MHPTIHVPVSAAVHSTQQIFDKQKFSHALEQIVFTPSPTGIEYQVGESSVPHLALAADLGLTCEYEDLEKYDPEKTNKAAETSSVSEDVRMPKVPDVISAHLLVANKKDGEALNTLAVFKVFLTQAGVRVMSWSQYEPTHAIKDAEGAETLRGDVSMSRVPTVTVPYVEIAHFISNTEFSIHAALGAHFEKLTSQFESLAALVHFANVATIDLSEAAEKMKSPYQLEHQFRIAWNTPFRSKLSRPQLELMVRAVVPALSVNDESVYQTPTGEPWTSDWQQIATFTHNDKRELVSINADGAATPFAGEDVSLSKVGATRSLNMFLSAQQVSTAVVEVPIIRKPGGLLGMKQ